MSLTISVISIVFVLNILGFIFGYLLKTDKFTDITYSLSFICASFFGLIFFAEISIFTILPVVMITLWGIRLGFFLLRRILAMGRDKRFDTMRDSVIKFGSFWLLQSVSIIIIILPVIFQLSIKDGTLGIFQWLGIFIWIVGWLLESIADGQKYQFKKTNPDQFFYGGIFRWIRYPNYLGELLVWTGIWIFGLDYYFGIWGWITIISPIWIFILLRYISGIPLVEAQRNAKYSNDLQYQEYKKSTPLLIFGFKNR